MPNYVKKTLKKFEHESPHNLKHSQHMWVPKTYGDQVHLASPEDSTTTLLPTEIRRI